MLSVMGREAKSSQRVVPARTAKKRCISVQLFRSERVTNWPIWPGDFVEAFREQRLRIATGHVFSVWKEADGICWEETRFRCTQADVATSIGCTWTSQWVYLADSVFLSKVTVLLDRQSFQWWGLQVPYQQEKMNIENLWHEWKRKVFSFGELDSIQHHQAEG